jgi:hypothetical protein
MVQSLAIIDSNLFAGVYDYGDDIGGLFLSTNNGKKWSSFNNNLTNENIISLAVIGTNIFAVTFPNNIFISTDKGSKWTAVNNDLTVSNVYGFAVSGENLFTATRNGVFLSTNNGINWSDVNNGLVNKAVSSLAINETNLYAGTSSGVWRRPLTEMITGVENKQIILPTSFSLQQNYPNPFNPTTTINYSIPKSGFVTIKVYDILGREVEALVNENRSVGNYSIQFNASKLVSGVYFYRMQAGDFIQTKKLILLK